MLSFLPSTSKRSAVIVSLNSLFHAPRPDCLLMEQLLYPVLEL